MANELLIPKVGALTQRPDLSAGDSSREGKLGGPAFDKILKDKIANPAAAAATEPGGLKFSAHALSRIRERSINMGSELMGKLAKAVDNAAAKGSKESLILTDKAAFIVSVKNKTVITVLDRNQMNGNVFTNIDSTVVV